MKKLDIVNADKVINRYTSRFKEFGVHPKTLGWDKGKQALRYTMLLELFDLERVSILDVGCGFGDALKVIDKKSHNYEYVGIDLVPKLIESASSLYEGKNNISFICDDFLNINFDRKFDIVIGSGLFNFKLIEMNNYDFIREIMLKSFELSNIGISFDFLSSLVDYEYDDTFHSEPAKIVEFSSQLTKNYCLNNTYMPFEFMVSCFNDDSFTPEDTIFKKFKNERTNY